MIRMENVTKRFPGTTFASVDDLTMEDRPLR